MPAVTLAGALALAGCGGGSSTPAAGPGENGNGNGNGNGGGNGGGNDGPVTLALPEGYTIDGGADRATGERGDYTIVAGETLRSGDLVFTCDSDIDCEINVGPSRRATSVTVNAGEVSVDVYEPSARDGAEQPDDDADDPLSRATLLEAIKASAAAGKKATLWSTATTQAGDEGNPATAIQRTLVSGETFNLHLGRNGSALYWGSWERYLGQTDGVRDNHRHGSVWGGTTRYGKKPETSLTSAQYDDEGSVVFRYSEDGGKTWMHGAAAADLELNADFTRGKIGGIITGDALDTPTGIAGTTAVAADSENDIRLMETDIDSAGTFEGDALFSHSSVRNQNGEWEGGFFGPTTSVTGGVQSHEEPSHVAGAFSVNRETIRSGAITTQYGLRIEGAFGAAEGDN